MPLLEQLLGDRGRFFIVHARWPTRQHDAFRPVGEHRGKGCGTGQNLRIDLRLANATRNQLRILGPVIENKNSIVPEFHQNPLA